MLDKLKEIYHSPDLYGESLIQPLRSYHGFFVEKIENSEGAGKVAWKIASVVPGIVGYLVLGIVAGIGMLLKIVTIPTVTSHNEQTKIYLMVVWVGVDACTSYASGSNNIPLDPQNYSDIETEVVGTFSVTKANSQDLQKEVTKKIDSSFRKLYYKTDGEITNNKGAITISLLVPKKK